LYRHNFSKRGRSFSSQLTLGLTDSDQAGLLDTRNSYFNTPGLPPREDLILQDQQTVGYRNNYGLTLSYTEPIAKRKYLEFNYNYRSSRNESDRDVFDIVSGDDRFNTNLSNHYVNSFDYHRAGVNYRMVHQDYNISFGVNAQEARLNGDFIDRNLEIKRNFTNILPTFRMQYNFSQTSNINFTYETNIQEPSITQLQPVVDNSNPLNISLGNPDLKPEYQHRLRLRYGRFNPATFQNFFGFVSLDYAQNDISYAQSTDSLFVRTSQPINVDYGYRVNSFLNYGFRIKALSLRVRFNGGLTYNKSNSLVNTQENFTTQWAPRAGVNFNYLYKDLIDLSFDANLRYTSTEYSLPTSQGQEFYTQIYSASAFFRLPKGFAIGSTLNYNVYSGLGDDFDGGVPLWGASLSKYVLKNNRGEIKFSTTDMLNRNVGISQNADVNYVEETRVSSLGRYFLLGFTYSLQALNKGQGGDRRGDMMRIIGQ
jgi:outer membrane receptor protein involved in Fe transport